MSDRFALAVPDRGGDPLAVGRRFDHQRRKSGRTDLDAVALKADRNHRHMRRFPLRHKVAVSVDDQPSPVKPQAALLDLGSPDTDALERLDRIDVYLGNMHNEYNFIRPGDK